MSHHLAFQFQATRCVRSILILVLLGASFAQTRDAEPKEGAPVQFVGMFSADGDVNGNRTPCQHLRDVIRPSAVGTGITGEPKSACDEVLDFVAGKNEAALARMRKPIVAVKVVVDSNQRVLITEPTERTVHILDFPNRKYSQIDGTRGDRMGLPYSIAVDADNNIYVTDLKHGRIAVYNADGKFIRYMGEFKGENLFENPRSIAIDRATGRIYVADSKRNYVVILNHDGKILAQIGRRGGGNGLAEFKNPIEIAVYKNEVFVLDQENVRVQVLDLDGNFRRQFHLRGGSANDANGMAFDSQGRLFIAALNWVEVFSPEGQLLFRFGRNGDQPGEFQTPKGICTDSRDRVYVTDTGNRRVQVFQVTDQPSSKAEAAR